MRVLFIYPDLAPDITHYTGVASYGLALLSAVLKRDGHAVDLYHLTERPTPEEFRERVRAARPDLVAFSANSHYARRLPSWTAWAREAAGAPVVVGGVHATLATAEVAALPAVDFTCVGEGEQPLRELCAALAAGRDATGIANIWARRGERVVRNAPRPLCDDLDTLPDPDLALFDFARLYPVRRGLFPYMMSRGCAYSCSYCSSHALREAAAGLGRYWRFLSPDRASSQLARLLARHDHGSTQVQFLDTIFFARREWLEEFAPLYRERVGRPFNCNLRADFVTPETAALLAGMGCATARFGVESGNEQLTTGMLRRGLSIQDIRRAFALLREQGIERVSYNLVGVPDETLTEALETIRLNAEIDPELAIAFIFYPYPGTALHRLCAQRGYLTAREYDHYFAGSSIDLPGFATADILFVQRFFRQLLKLYGLGRRWPAGPRRAWWALLDDALRSPLLPRGAAVAAWDHYKRLRHLAGERLLARSPRAYRLLGGTDPL